MTLSVETIQNQYPYVFKNEFESLTILASNSKTEKRFNQRVGNYLQDVTYLLTKNSKGEMEHSKYWFDVVKKGYCYSFIIEPYTYRNGQFD